MAPPLWKALSRAIRWFNYGYSLPRVSWSGLRVFAGLTHVGSPEKPLVMTCSISEDYARLWLYFAKRSLGEERWDFLIIDSAGTLDHLRAEGCQVVRFPNIAHGQKIDTFLRRVIRSDLIFMCDDDKYILNDMTDAFRYLDAPNTPVVSFHPRDLWTFKIQGKDYLPMGTFALLFQRSFFLEHDLRFLSPRGVESPYIVCAPGAKQDLTYDTVDYANEQLLLQGYNIEIRPDHASLLGFEGLSALRILLMKFGKAYVLQTLQAARHFRPLSSNAIIRPLYGLVKFERFYDAVFHERPRFVSGLSEDELRDIVERNPNPPQEQKDAVLAHFTAVEETYQHLLSHVRH